MRPILLAALCFMAFNACGDQPAAQAPAKADRATLEAAQARMAAERAAAERAASEKAAMQLAIDGLPATNCPGQQRVVHNVDLDRPGALAELERANPRHFAALQVVLKDPTPRLGPTATWMRTQMNACEFAVMQIYKTSYPPQATVSFVVDDTRYRKTMYIDTPQR